MNYSIFNKIFPLKILISSAICSLSFTGVALAQNPSPTPAVAASLSLHPLFQNNGVLQRDDTIPIWGAAETNGIVTVKFRGIAKSAIVDSDGKWRIDMPSGAAGGPFPLIVEDDKGRNLQADMLVGDVFLCSGQSNMEWQVRYSRNSRQEMARPISDDIRLLTVEKTWAPSAKSLPTKPIRWLEATPETIGDFSAVCYFFGLNFRNQTKAPIGLISSAWGGSIIQDWMGPSALRAVGGYERSLSLLELYDRDPKSAWAQIQSETDKWTQQFEIGQNSAIPWSSKNYDDSAWKKMTVPNTWENTGIEEMRRLDGVVWFRRQISLSREQAKQMAWLELGQLDERDTSFLNGKAIGAVAEGGNRRIYSIPPRTLIAGENNIAIRIIDLGGPGGFRSPGSEIRLRLEDGSIIPLAGEWKFQIAADFSKSAAPPPVPWIATRGTTSIYNAMIAPLQPYRIKGALFYQGESNAPSPSGYQSLLEAMVRDWRNGFETDFTFLNVQLSGWGPYSSEPKISGPAAIREAQRLASKNITNSGIAVTIDVGNARDIHPTEKQEVGARLNYEAMRLILANRRAPQTPEPLDAKLGANGIVVRFSNIGDGLVIYGGLRPNGFEVCNSNDECEFADAKLQNNEVTLTSSRIVAPVRVRYAMSDTPIVNFYGKNGLPVIPFELQVIK